MAKTSSSARKEQDWTVTEQTEAAETQPRKGQLITLLKVHKVKYKAGTLIPMQVLFSCLSYKMWIRHLQALYILCACILFS